MAEQIPPSDFRPQQESSESWTKKESTPKPPPRRPLYRRWWFLSILAVLIGLGLLVALAPWIASTGMARSIILNKVNAQLNGKVEVSDWDLGWSGGIVVRGVRIYQADGVQILEMERLATELTVMDVLRGNYYTLGKTTVDGLAMDLRQYNDGTNNFQRLVKGGDAPASPGEARTPPPEAPFIMPPISGDFSVDLRGTVERQDPIDPRKWQVVQIDRSTIKANVPNINGDIQHDVRLAVRLGGGSTGSIVAVGVADLFEEGQFDLKALTAQETLEIHRLDNAALVAFLPVTSGIEHMAGLTGGRFTVNKTVGGESMSAEGTLTSDGFELGGAALQGDTFKTPRLVINLPKSTYDRISGRLRTGSDGPATPMTITFHEGASVVQVGADATVWSLLDVLNNQRASAPGAVASVIKLDLPRLTAQLPNLLNVDKGAKVELSSGNFEQTVNVRLEEGKAIVSQQAKISNVRGTRDGRPIEIRPIVLALDATSYGGGGAIPDLRDLKLNLQSSFATINGSGTSISDLKIPGTIKLDEAQRELGQVLDFGALKMAGVVQLDITSEGDLTQPGSTAILVADVTATDLRLEGIMDAPINEPWLRTTARGTLHRGREADTFLASISDALATLQSGNAQKPTVDLEIAGRINLHPALSADYEIKRGNVDLPAASSEFAAIFAPLTDPKTGQGIQIAAGRLNISGNGNWTSSTTRVDALQVRTIDLRLRKGARDVLRDYDGTISLAGEMTTGATGLAARLSRLIVKDQQDILNIEKFGAPDIRISLPAAGGLEAQGKLAINAQLKPVQDILRGLGRQPLQVQAGAEEGAPAGEILAGLLKGTVDLAPVQGQRTAFDGQFTIEKLSLATSNPQQPIRDENVTFFARGTSDAAMKDVQARNVELRSSFATVVIANAVLRLAGENDQPVPPLEMVQSAQVTVDVPSVPKLDALVTAFLPPAPDGAAPVERPAPAAPAKPAPAGTVGRRAAPPAAAPAASEAETPAELPPIAWTSGSLNGVINITGGAAGTQVSVEHLNGKSLAFKRGEGALRPMDISLTLKALMKPARAAAGASFMQQIAELNVTELAGKLGVADVTLVEPVSMKQAADGRWMANGAVKASGELLRVSELLDALAARGFDRESALGGAYVTTQQLATDRGIIKIKGQADVNNFVIGPAGNPKFTEKRIRIADELDLDQAKEDLLIRQLDLSMESTQALAASVRGRVAKYVAEREFHGLSPGEKMTVSLSYDSAKVLELVRPFVSAEAQGQLPERAVGIQKDRKFIVTGKMPSEPQKRSRRKNAKEAHPLYFTNVHGSLLFDEVEWHGVVAQDVEVPIYVTKGVLETVYLNDDGTTRLPPPAVASGGTVDIGGFAIEYLEDPMRLSQRRKDFNVIDGVRVPHKLVDNVGGAISPLFAQTEEARGHVTLRITELSRMPLGQALKQSRKQRDGGIARVEFTAEDFAIKNLFGAALARQLNLKLNPDGTLPLAIKGAQVGLTDGLVSSDITFPLLGHPLGTRGTVRLSDGAIIDMTLLVPKELIPSRDVQRLALLKDRIEVPITGTVRRWNMDIVQAALRSIDPTNLIPGLLDGGRDRRRDEEREPRRDDRNRPPEGTIGRPAR